MPCACSEVRFVKSIAVVLHALASALHHHYAWTISTSPTTPPPTPTRSAFMPLWTPFRRVLTMVMPSAPPEMAVPGVRLRTAATLCDGAMVIRAWLEQSQPCAVAQGPCR